MSGRITRADQRYFLTAAKLRLDRGGPVVHRRSFELCEIWQIKASIARAAARQRMEARDERCWRALQKHLNTVKLLIVDELGYVPFTAVGSELLFEMFSQCYERGANLVTSNMPFDEWTSIFGSERLTGALLDRLTHHIHILEMNGESYRNRVERFFNRIKQCRRVATRYDK